MHLLQTHIPLPSKNFDSPIKCLQGDVYNVGFVFEVVAQLKFKVNLKEKVNSVNTPLKYIDSK
jgi:hypothetical protein